MSNSDWFDTYVDCLGRAFVFLALLVLPAIAVIVGAIALVWWLL